MLGLQLHHPAPGSDLELQAPVRVQAGGDGTLDAQGDAAGKRDGPQGHQAGAPGDLQLEPGGRPQGQVVVDAPVDVDPEPVPFLPQPCQTRVPEPQPAIALPARHDHRLPIQHQGHQPGLGRQRQALRGLSPVETTGNRVLPGRKLHRRAAVPRHHRKGAATAGRVLGPDLRVTGQGHPGLGIDLPTLGEAPALGAQVQMKTARPGTDSTGHIPAPRIGPSGWTSGD